MKSLLKWANKILITGWVNPMHVSVVCAQNVRRMKGGKQHWYRLPLEAVDVHP